MSNFRILILVLLVVVLAVLGLIYVNISGRMDVIQKQGQMAAAPAVPTSAASPSYLPVPMPSSNTPMQPAVVQDPVVKEELAHATAELERIKKENEELRKEIEAKIMEHKDELMASTKKKKKASKLEEAAAKAAAASEDVPEDGAVSLDTVDTSEDLEVSAEDDFEEFDPA